MCAQLVSAERLGRIRPLLAIEHRQADARDTPMHAHAPGQLLASASGLLAATTAAGSWIVPATHAVWMPPQVQHAVRSHGPYAGWSVYVEESACAALPAAPRTVRVSALLREAVRRMASLGGAPTTPAGHRLAAVILDEIAMLPAEPLDLPHPQDPRAAKVAQAILSDLADSRPLEQWAQWAGMTPRTLARRFGEETGLGAGAWRQRARALRAIEMLAQGRAVTAIAIDLGYQNVSAFIAMFRRETGATPGAYLAAQAPLAGGAKAGE